jgi:hypothetical protein
MRSARLLAVAVLAVVLAMAMTGPAYATLTTITPSADNYLSSFDPSTNYGADATGYVRSGYTGGYNGAVDRLVLKFDLSAIPACSSVNSAYLLLYYFDSAQSDPAGRTYNAYRLIEDWSETGSTWNSRDTGVPWTTAGGVWTTEGYASSIVPPSYGQWMSWDVTGIVKDWIESNQPNNGFIIRDPNDGVSSTDAAAIFRLRQWTSESVRPVLKIDYTAGSCPEEAVGGVVIPADAFAIVAPWLAVIGLVGCIGTAAVLARKRSL